MPEYLLPPVTILYGLILMTAAIIMLFLYAKVLSGPAKQKAPKEEEPPDIPIPSSKSLSELIGELEEGYGGATNITEILDDYECIEATKNNISPKRDYPYSGGSIFYDSKKSFDRDMDVLKSLSHISLQERKELGKALCKAYNERSYEQYESWLNIINQHLLTKPYDMKDTEKRLDEFVNKLWDFVDHQEEKNNPTDEYYISEEDALLLNEIYRKAQKFFEPDFKDDDCIDPEGFILEVDNEIIRHILRCSE